MTSEIDLSPVFKRCLYCGNEYPIRFFRRWHMMKYRIMPTCNGCTPPKRLKEMTPMQRKQALETTHRNTSAAYVEAMNQRQKDYNYNTKLPDLQYARQARKRRANWREALIASVVDELRWAKAALIRYRKATATRPERKPYINFFEEYIKVLENLRDQTDTRANKRGAPVTLTEEDKNPLTYIDPLRVSYLKELYNKCPVIPSTRLPRDPWFLYWKK